jgi:hypothetical protein
VNLLQDPDGAKYEEALLQFRKAYELLGSWKVLGNIGICSLKLERDGEAIEAFEKYLAGGKGEIEKNERAQVERDLVTLKASVVRVHFEFPAAGVTVVDQRDTNRGQRVVNEYAAAAKTLELGLHPGHHTMVAKIRGGAEESWDINLSPGASMSHTFVLASPVAAAPPPPTPTAAAPSAPSPTSTSTPPPAAPESGDERPVPTTVYVFGAATLALAAGAAVTGGIALSKRSAFDELNGQPNHSPSEVQDAHDSAKTMGLVNTALTGAAVVGAGLTAYFYFSRPKVGSSTALAPWVTTGGGGLVVRGAL